MPRRPLVATLALAMLVPVHAARGQDGFVNHVDIVEAEDTYILEQAGLPRTFARLSTSAGNTTWKRFGTEPTAWGNGRAQYAPLVLALAWRDGVGTPASAEKAAHYARLAIRRAAETANDTAEARAIIGRAEYVLATLERDARAREPLLARAAATGSPLARVAYADVLLARARRTDAVALLARAAAEGYGMAHWKLGRLYLDDSSAVARDSALHHLRRAAQVTVRGTVVEAQLALADLAHLARPEATGGWGLEARDLGVLREREIIERTRLAKRAKAVSDAAAQDPVAATLRALALRWRLADPSPYQSGFGSLVQFADAAMRAEPYSMVVMGELLEAQGDPRARQWYARAASRGSVRATFLAREWAATPEAARAFLESAATLGLAEAQLELADALFTGRYGAKKDRRRAEDLYARAAAQGDPRDLLHIARSYELGKVAPRDPAKALSAWVQAGQAGSSEAALRLGQAFESGKGVGRNLDQAAMWYELSGHAESIYRAAFWYESGALGRVDPERARQLYAAVARVAGLDSLGLEATYRQGLMLETLGRVRKAGQFSREPYARAAWESAAGNGHAPSALKAAILLDEDLNTTRVQRGGQWVRVPKPRYEVSARTDELFALYAAAARGGEPWGMYRAAQLLIDDPRPAREKAYVDDEGTRYCTPTDRRPPASLPCDVDALELLERAVARGLPAAKVRLGDAFYWGGWNLKADQPRARELYRQAAEAGDALGQYTYAQALLWDDDLTAGERWMRRAATSGHAQAREWVGKVDAARAARAAREAQLAAMRPPKRPTGFWVTLVEVLAGIEANLAAERRAAEAFWANYRSIGPDGPITAGTAASTTTSSSDAESSEADASDGGGSTAGGSSGSGTSSGTSGSGMSSGTSGGGASGGGASGSGSSGGGSSGGGSSANGTRSSGSDRARSKSSEGYLVIEKREPYFVPVQKPVDPPRVVVPQSTTPAWKPRKSTPCTAVPPSACVSPQ